MYAIPTIVLVLGLILYYKFPRWRLWIGVGLIVIGFFELIEYLQAIIAYGHRDYSYYIPLYWYIGSFAQVATIILGFYCLKNRVKDEVGINQLLNHIP